MFSEYASRFLAQSQSRLSNFGQPDPDHSQRQNDWASSRPGRSQRDAGRGPVPARSFLARGYGGNPYQQNGAGSRFGPLGFASRISAAQDAPLFYSTLDEFRDEDDEEEREREAADLYALQRSRRVAAASKLAESAESANSHASVDESADQTQSPYRSHGLARGIKSSWNATRSTHQPHVVHDALLEEAEEVAQPRGDHADHDTKGKMVDIGLESQEDGDEEPPESLLGGEAPAESSPPPFQQFNPHPEREPFMLKRSATDDTEPSSIRRQDPAEFEPAAQQGNLVVEGELFKHDPFFAWIFLISLAGMMSTFVLVWLHTSPRKSPVGDTIYATLQKSFDMLVVDTVVAVAVSFFWLAALRSFVRPVVNIILVAVPVIMLSFSLYTFVSSFQGRTKGSSVQDSVMRWASLVPAASCILWLWLVAKGRRAIQQAIEMLQFSCKILAQNPALLLVGFGCLGLIVFWTWAWLAMFTRVFMGGYFSTSLVRFVIRLSSWWLGAAFILMYLWTLAVINAVHRATTAATVSQWYFHRNAGPATPSSEIVLAALSHATTTIFGSICESTLLSLLLRAPLLFLPRRIGSAITNLAAFWIPTPMVALTNPLSVTYAAIHSQSLATSARGLDQMEVVSPAIPTTTLTPRALRLRGQANGLLPYRLAKLLLVATRFIMATGLGFAGWVITAKQLQIQLPDGMGMRGSAYAYVVGIMASFIGYSVMGAMEGILSGIVDAVLICYGSERRMERGHGRFCLEAAHLFGERRIGEEGYA
ncbi:plasma-membrane choline transporter [Hirsutella rhossiliensis]|uniref:Protein PNS1 n=1 Tax=Hirsutella rhossiliensis TaxID=111463 RepID=A0A9P8N418_9HYPO|nr:plasma-membrane choline transporter domain-containing protein [Hirsutella rhossiliensis]KAH0966429.1 plasma-membrane choline transporter domain-containing protein [Hirsutella rhossiliensis]